MPRQGNFLREYLSQPDEKPEPVINPSWYCTKKDRNCPDVLKEERCEHCPLRIR